MKRSLAAVSLALVVSCASLAVETGGEAVPRTTWVSTVPGPPAATTTTWAVPSSVTSTTPEPAEPLAWLSPSGVPMSILSRDGSLLHLLTPCGREAPLVLGSPLFATTVVIDPGHGGPRDSGAVGPTGLREKDVNLRVARALEFLLEMRGITAILTRTGDYPSRLFVRSQLADSLQARVLVSIHHNAPTPPTSGGPGTLAFVQSGSEESARLGGLIWSRVAEAFSLADVDWSTPGDAGALTVLNTRGTDAYGMLRHPTTTSVLVELGYITNRSEAEFFASEVYPFYAGSALADAIADYLETDARGVDLGPGRIFDPRPGISSEACVDPDLD